MIEFLSLKLKVLSSSIRVTGPLQCRPPSVDLFTSSAESLPAEVARVKKYADPIGRERHPRVGSSKVAAAHTHRRPGNGHLHPGAVVPDAGVNAARRTIAPPILLIPADDVLFPVAVPVNSASGDPRLDLAVGVHRARLGGDVVRGAASEGRGARDLLQTRLRSRLTPTP